MEQDLKLRGLSPATIRNYLLYCSNFALFYKRSPEKLGSVEVRDFLLHQIQVEPAGPHELTPSPTIHDAKPCGRPNGHVEASGRALNFGRFCVNIHDAALPIDHRGRNALAPAQTLGNPSPSFAPHCTHDQSRDYPAAGPPTQNLLEQS